MEIVGVESAVPFAKVQLSFPKTDPFVVGILYAPLIILKLFVLAVKPRAHLYRAMKQVNSAIVAQNVKTPGSRRKVQTDPAIEKMGRYIAITIKPTTPPIPTIMMGSIIDIIAAIALSTSSS